MADAHTLLRAVHRGPPQAARTPTRASGSSALPEGKERAKLAALIDAYLARAPDARVGPRGLPRLGPRALRRAARTCALYSQAGSWPAVLPALREKARIKRSRPSRAAGGRPRSPGQAGEGGRLLPRDGDGPAAVGGRRRQGAGRARLDPRAERRGAAAGGACVRAVAPQDAASGGRRSPAPRATPRPMPSRRLRRPRPPRSGTRSTASSAAARRVSPPLPHDVAHMRPQHDLIALYRHVLRSGDVALARRLGRLLSGSGYAPSDCRATATAPLAGDTTARRPALNDCWTAWARSATLR